MLGLLAPAVAVAARLAIPAQQGRGRPHSLVEQCLLARGLVALPGQGAAGLVVRPLVATLTSEVAEVRAAEAHRRSTAWVAVEVGIVLSVVVVGASSPQQVAMAVQTLVVVAQAGRARHLTRRVLALVAGPVATAKDL